MKIDRSLIIIIVLFLMAGLVSWNSFLKDYMQDETVNIHIFPKQIGEWTSEELTISEHDYAVLETKNAFTRKYSTPDGEEVYLFIVYSQHNRKVSHPPEICYSGGGATFLSNVSRTFEVGPPANEITANKILVDYKNFEQVMYYWFKVGDTFTSNYWKQQALIAIKSLLGKPASSALIRLTADVKDDDPDKSSRDIEKFTRLIAPLLTEYLP